jgi:hypothetical protein
MNVEQLYKIRNDFNSYQKLINLFIHNKDKSFDVIDIELKGWFSANTSSMLGAILTLFQNNLNTVNINGGNSKNILEQNGFLSFFGHNKINDHNSTTIPYQVLAPEDDRYFNNYVFKEFLSQPDLPGMTKALKKRLAESIYEIFICGQFFPAKKKIEFMITDIGIGIKNVVNNRFDSNLLSTQAIEWAIEDKNTTKHGVSGGIGLALLYEFINLNKGTVQIVSNDGFWELSQEGVTVSSFAGNFPGTMVNISVRTDDKHQYMLSNEKIEDIF